MSARRLIAGAVLALMIASASGKQPYTLEAEIGLTHFGDRFTERSATLAFSPNREYFAVYTERGRLDLGHVEDAITIYRSSDALAFLKQPANAKAPEPIWTLSAATHKDGPILSDWRWLDDSTGVAYLQRVDPANRQLMLATLSSKRIEALTSAEESIKYFTIRDRKHFVYIARDPAPAASRRAEQQAVAVLGTGRPISELIFPEKPGLEEYSSRGFLRAVVEGRTLALDPPGGPPIASGGDLALSPDGLTLVTDALVLDVPGEWEKLYPPPRADAAQRVRAGAQSPDSFGGLRQYVHIDLLTGQARSLTGAPSGEYTGWFGFGTAKWANDNRHVLLPNTFFPNPDGQAGQPCVAVMDVRDGTHTCVEMMSPTADIGTVRTDHRLREAEFIDGDASRVRVIFRDKTTSNMAALEYAKRARGWQVASRVPDTTAVRAGAFDVSIRESFTESPKLLVTRGAQSRVLWDPNPQLQDIEQGTAVVYRWTDPAGLDWHGGLYRPAAYQPGKRYPLVIQTHGFSDAQFEPSGLYPSAFAARALAAAGMLVLQVSERGCPLQVHEESVCASRGYVSAVKKLVSESVVDEQNIGLIGFSRTCLYVMRALTDESFAYKAASVTDGVMDSYFQYWAVIDSDEAFLSDADGTIGAKPFGAGLQLWLQRSPTFQLDRVKAPLLVNTLSPTNLLLMWEPYAGLRRLNKPVELVMMRGAEHVLTDPAVRMASQGGSVDWFRFWLKGEEDASPSKADQYRRWRALAALPR